MKATLVLLLCLLSAVVGQTIYARAVIRSIGPYNVTGYALFSQLATGGNVTVQIVANGFGANDIPRGIHVHQYGDLSDMTAGLSVGGHWNPTNAAHGCPEINVTRHYGDMGNWQVVNGAVNETKTLDLLTLTGVDSIVGRAVVVHGMTDDCAQYINGAAGPRWGFGVIGIVNSTAEAVGGSGEANNTAGGIVAANCYLQPSSGSNVSGWVWLFQANDTAPTTVMAQVSGINSTHGFHLHWFGDIRAANGLATGGHFNPAGNKHGVPPYVPRHLGDMGVINFTDASTGMSYYTYSNDQISLNGLNNVIGRAIHVHLNGDNCVNPIGDGGARIAQCVIGVVNSTLTMPSFPAGVPTTQPGEYVCGLIYNNTMSSSGSSTNSGMTATTTSPSNDVAKIIINFGLIFAALLVFLY